MKEYKWSYLVEKAIKKTNTPFYLFSSYFIDNQLNNITKSIDYPVQNCLSLKTLSLKELLKWWRKKGLYAEVTSEYELKAALYEGFEPSKIIVNGVSKHSWDKKIWVNNLRVHFDSLSEISNLLSIAKKKKWKVGLRFHPNIQNDPENPSFPDQFGMPVNDFLKACELIRNNDLELEGIHIHLRSNIPCLKTIKLAINEFYETIKFTNINLKYIDLGGGLPAMNIISKESIWNSNYNLKDHNILINYVINLFPSLDEVILENGRFILANCGILVLSVIDIKMINGTKFLICNGGRTNNALPSDWEEHNIEVFPKRNNKFINYSLCGPTCMAYDCFARIDLPEEIQISDKIVYHDAGAYHLGWENRFSQPLSSILWHDHENNTISVVRKRESFNNWWNK